MSILGTDTAVSAKGKTDSCPVSGGTCIDIDDSADTGGGGGAGFFQKYPKPYCNNSKFPTKVSYSKQYYLMNTGKQYPISPDLEIWPKLEDISLLDLSLDPGEIHTHVRWHTHCEGTNAKGDAVMEKAIEFWMPLVTVDAINYQFDLVARVVDQLGPPEVKLVDADKDHGWLWVNVEHHVAIEPPETEYSAETVSNPSGTATAWVRGVPLELTLELPADTGVEGLAECDLKVATSAAGCPIKFSHSSSIADDGWFRGTATLYWGIMSNSGKYNGLGPFTTISEFETQVAEAMAVSGP